MVTGYGFHCYSEALINYEELIFNCYDMKIFTKI